MNKIEYKILISVRADKDLESLEPAARNRIIKKLRFFQNSSDPLHYAKALSGPLRELFRFRVGEYRILFEQDKKGRIIILMILRVQHRRDVYE